ncbi:MAG TPA: hypothetical protein VFH51_03905, partial [Myxococcota bacterium]|nr:hypothetical protein [Myxococcota bacterium]
MTRASYVRVSIMAALLGVQACGGAGTVGSGDTTSAPAAGPGGTMPPQDAPVQVMPPAPGDPNGDRLPPAPGPGTAPGSAP